MSAKGQSKKTNTNGTAKLTISGSAGGHVTVTVTDAGYRVLTTASNSETPDPLPSRAEAGYVLTMIPSCDTDERIAGLQHAGRLYLCFLLAVADDSIGDDSIPQAAAPP